MYYDTIIRIKNASAVGKEKVKIPFTKMDEAILNILSKFRYVKSITKKGRGIKRILDVELSYRENGQPRVSEIKFISKPQKRVYKSYSDLYSVRSGYGLGIISTPKGIMTVEDARKEKVGGEYLFQVW
ncbi:MAG: 30S ribosomal protein S8 [Candidatus Liptonbacteria bacterium CG11_big_fil_rev_8_21_14_0_20_35_14]|uniref:Small ribosomal subunit protein uS8 n=1 Tax=Candidatus Liptonbacteria bacterium CG11_big_fil_rev_8_21_14_0_20_35_14 TaxID=1974634 RepID=A0A2H0NAF4_9BACT|nr:MAG: 30S ribosomal protein S8 [Candidatus Liptonbacteria bacterium CG11_big_fil_rev_8_21_14_0_20_35_14]